MPACSIVHVLPHDQYCPHLCVKMLVKGPVQGSYTLLRVRALQDMLGRRSVMCLAGSSHPKPPEATWRLCSGTRLRTMMMSHGTR